MAEQRDKGGTVEVGDTVRIHFGATRWLKERGHWADYILHEIDGMAGIVVKDLTWLGGEKSRLCIDLGFQHPVSVPSQFVEKVLDAA